ncbi:MAG: hypothetical protein BWZ10_00265 [candidate division BRC1 bacterium ADurb.BinA364]|nr:MAG: hypothetical protein BWZ10_00265 [candidate division BRC1 bacterium ADurb.BinA364]
MFRAESDGFDLFAQARRLGRVHAVDFQVLAVGRINELVAVLFGEFGDALELMKIHFALGNHQPLDGQSAPVDGIGAGEGPRGRGGAAIRRRRRFEGRGVHAERAQVVFDDAAAELDPLARDDELQPRSGAIEAVAMVAVEHADGMAQPVGRFGRNERIERLGLEGLPAHAAADPHAESQLLAAAGQRAGDGRQTGAIDVRLGAIGRAAGEGDLEFARQVVQLARLGQPVGDSLGERRDVDPRVGANRGPGAGHGVARHIAAAVEGGQFDLGQIAHQIGDRAQLEPMQLDCLAGGDGKAALGVVAGDARKRPRLRGGHDAGGHHHAGHQEPFLARLVDAMPFGDQGLFGRHRSLAGDLVEVQQQSGVLDRLFVAALHMGNAPLHGEPRKNEWRWAMGEEIGGVVRIAHRSSLQYPTTNTPKKSTSQTMSRKCQ